MTGGPDTIRTCDLCLRRAALYPAELRVLTGRGRYGKGRDGASRGARFRRGVGRLRLAIRVEVQRRSATLSPPCATPSRRGRIMGPNPISFALFVVFAGVGALSIVTGRPIALGATLIILGVLILAALKMAQQWEKVVILRAGKFTGIKGPGLFVIIPILDIIAAWVDTRIRTTQFLAEQTLTKDTVPVDVDAIIFWVVTDVRKATLEVANYTSAIGWAAQTSLREMIGAADLATLLSNRQAADEQLRKSIDLKTVDWGISVKSVEIRDVKIPEALQDAMSRQAQAERERQARVILGSAEAEIAQKFVEAARTYADYPIALHLRGMNILYESVKERGSTIIVPSNTVDCMNLGGVAGIASLARAGTANPQERGSEAPPDPWSSSAGSTPEEALTGC